MNQLGYRVFSCRKKTQKYAGSVRYYCDIYMLPGTVNYTGVVGLVSVAGNLF